MLSTLCYWLIIVCSCSCLFFFWIIVHFFPLFILQSATWQILNIISRPKTNYPGINFSVVLDLLLIPYPAVDSNPVKYTYKSPYSSNPLVHNILVDVWYIISTIWLAWGLALLAIFTLRPYSFLHNHAWESFSIKYLPRSAVIYGDNG